jgi:hypothetical protein
VGRQRALQERLEPNAARLASSSSSSGLADASLGLQRCHALLKISVWHGHTPVHSFLVQNNF